MQSHEVLKRAAESIGVKALAARLRLSSALVYKWCQEHDTSDRDASGARNPLDRVLEIVQATGDRGVVAWLCRRVDGFLASNPIVPKAELSTELIVDTQRLVQEFSRLLTTVTKSMENDSAIQPEEADRIRNAWEALKSTAETFSVACERGLYDKPISES